MFTSILEEVVNGWCLNVYGGKDGKRSFIYERYYDANQARAQVEAEYQRELMKERLGYDAIM